MCSIDNPKCPLFRRHRQLDFWRLFLLALTHDSTDHDGHLGAFALDIDCLIRKIGLGFEEKSLKVHQNPGHPLIWTHIGLFGRRHERYGR